MSWFDGIRHRLGGLLRPDARARDIEEEMRLHHELASMQLGDSRAASLQFGNRTYYREETRRASLMRFVDVLCQDALFAWRSMRREAAFTMLALFTLALGIGLNASTFAVLDLVFFRPPGGIEKPDGLRRVYVEHFRTGDGVPFFSTNLNYPMFSALRETMGDTSRAAVYATDFALRMGKHPSSPRLRGVWASANYFDVLGVRMAMGRPFHAAEDRMGSGVPVAVISHRFWQQHFQGDSTVLGKTLDVEGNSFTVVGVLDDEFTGMDLQACDVWMPLSTMPTPSWMRNNGQNWWESTNMYSLQAVYRSRAVDVDEAMSAVATARIRALNRERDRERADTLMNVQYGPLSDAQGPQKAGMEMKISSRLAGVSLIVLLIACANVINLLLARATRRRHEFAVRLALGVSRTRLVRLLTTETVLLALVALVPAVLFAWWGGALLRGLIMPEVEWYDAAVTGRVLVAALAVALFAGVVAGIVPALQASREDVVTDLKATPRTGAGRKSRLRMSLVVAQAALSVVLLVGAGLFVRSLSNVQNLDIGYDSNELVFGSLQFAQGERPPADVMRVRVQQVAERLEDRAAIAMVARALMEPMQGIFFTDFFTERDSLATFKENPPTATVVSSSFFATVGMKFIAGETFSYSREGAPNAEIIVNESMARRLWPDGNALGKCIRVGKSTNDCHVVVGVVEDTRRDRVIEDVKYPQFFMPIGADPINASGSVIVARAAQSTALAVSEVRAALQAEFPTALVNSRVMRDLLEPEYRPWRLAATLFSAFGALALLVAVVGIYSTVSYGVAQRTQEFGVRIALGAQMFDVLRQVVRESLSTVIVGVVMGAILALAGGRLVQSLLYEVDAYDPITLGAVAAILLGTAALAALLPAIRASRVDPVRALKAE